MQMALTVKSRKKATTYATPMVMQDSFHQSTPQEQGAKTVVAASGAVSYLC